MRLDWDKIPSIKPAYYARRILKEFNITKPPVNEIVIAHHLGLRIIELDNSDLKRFPGFDSSLIKNIKQTGAWYKPKESRIYVFGGINNGRKRLSIFHEFSHAILPWHKDLNCFNSEKYNNDREIKLREREAYKCASELIMPSEWLASDDFKKNICFDSIKILASTYQVSQENAADNYVLRNPGILGLVVILPTSNKKRFSNISSDGLELFETSQEELLAEEKLKDPLTVKYFVKSKKFPNYINRGTPIGKENPVYKIWLEGKQVSGTLPPNIMDSSGISYNYEFMPTDNKIRAYLLLWHCQEQLELYDSRC